MPTVYITCPPAAADEIAQTLVQERMVACVNRVDCRSTYRWEGEVIDDDETILLCKTTTDRYNALVDAVHDIHPYEVPCIERFDEGAVDEPFAAWIDASVQSG